MNEDKQISMFEAPPAIRHPLTEVPLKCWENETVASAEGREFLKIITEVDHDVIDRNYEPYAIEAWLHEMSYGWNGSSWVFKGEE